MASIASSSSFQICLTAVGEPRQIIIIPNIDTCSVEELRLIAKDAFGGRDCIDLKSGFPPKSLDPKSLVRSVLSRNDRVAVTLKENVTSALKKKNHPGTTNGAASDNNVDPWHKSEAQMAVERRSQRAASKAATESFPLVIKEQNKRLKDQKQGATTRTASKRKQPPTTNHAAAAAVSSSQKKNISSSSPSSRKLAKLPGRRLRDGEEVGPKPTSSPLALGRRRSAGKGDPKFNNTEDVSFALLTALEHGGGGGKVGNILRGAMRNAISQQYDISRAVTRVSAVQGGKCKIAEQSAFLVVTFNKGLEGRGTFEEVVDAIPREALELVLKGIHATDPESLRAPMLAQLSPRVFWSLLKETSSNGDVGRSIEDALKQLLPALDWSFLRRRKETLSEKAKENLRQKAVKTKDGSAEEGDLQASAEAVQAVEHAMEYLHEYDHMQRRDRAARAALARFEYSDRGDGAGASSADEQTLWQLVTPTEQDEEELITCSASQEYVSKLIGMGIHNWRQLANADSTSIAKQLQFEERIVEEWVDRAQQESVEEVIVEICDGRVDVVEILIAEANTGTPKDLANWRSMPDLLFECSPSSFEGLGISIDDLAIWSKRAYEVMQVYEWMSWYATPVD